MRIKSLHRMAVPHVGGGSPGIVTRSRATTPSAYPPARLFGVAVEAGAPEHRHHRLGGGDDALHGRFPAVHGDELDPHHQRGDGEEDDPDAARYPWCELKNRSKSGRATATQSTTRRDCGCGTSRHGSS